MSDFDRPGMTKERPPRRQSAASRFGELGDRLSRTFSGSERSRNGLPGWEPEPQLDYAEAGDTIAWAPGAQRFQTVVQGYDPDEVDQHLDSLERELAELRSQRGPGSAVAAEFDRIGEQTAAILRTAYEQAEEITRGAQAQADRCLQDAAANAVSITEDAKRRLRQLDVETDSVWQERTRLIEDARGVATELFSLAESAIERFPAEPEKAERTVASSVARFAEGTQPPPAPVAAYETAPPAPAAAQNSAPPPAPGESS